MNLITDLVFNQEVYSFNLEGTGHQLTNAAQYDPNGKRYKWKNPYPGTENEQFILIGDGNHRVTNDQLVQEVAFVILLKQVTDDHYAIQRIVFNEEFVLF